MNDTLKISSHDDLLSYVPHALGFRRPVGMVCVPMGGGPMARVDLPATEADLEPFLSSLTNVYLHRHPARRMALVAYGEDRSACLDALGALSQRLIDDPNGPEVGPMLWVNGDEWFDVLENTSGTIQPSTRARFDAEFALRGRVMPVETRADMAVTMRGDPSGIAERLPAALERVMGMDASTRVAEVAWLGSTLEGFVRGRDYLPDPEAARVLAILHDGGARDASVTMLTRENAPVCSEFWQDLVRRAPSDVRDAPATLLALSSFLEGNGAKAWTALDQVSEHDRLADLVATALENAMDPRDWEALCPTPSGGAAMQHAALRPTADQIGPDRRSPETKGPGRPGCSGLDPSSPSR